MSVSASFSDLEAPRRAHWDLSIAVRSPDKKAGRRRGWRGPEGGDGCEAKQRARRRRRRSIKDGSSRGGALLLLLALVLRRRGPRRRLLRLLLLRVVASPRGAAKGRGGVRGVCGVRGSRESSCSRGGRGRSRLFLRLVPTFAPLERQLLQCGVEIEGLRGPGRAAGSEEALLNRLCIAGDFRGDV